MRSYCAVICTTLGLALTASMAAGQAMLPVTLRNAPAIGPAEQGQIDAFVKGQVASLEGNEAASQSAARDALVNAANGTSPAFDDAYARTINGAMVGLAGSNQWRVKLNAAIVAAKVAEKTSSPRLYEAASKFIADKDDSIALWGLKIAKAVIPATLATQGAAANPALIKAVTAAALARPTGAIAAEAYSTLAPRVTSETKNLEAMVKALMPELLQLMAARNKAYLTGLPEEPTAENSALLFITYKPVWAIATQQQLNVPAMQQIVNLISLAGQRSATVATTDLTHLAPLLQQAGKAMQVLGTDPGLGALQGPAAALSKASATMGGQNINTVAQAMVAAVKGVDAFSGLATPPTITAGTAAATAPAAGGTAAATGGK